MVDRQQASVAYVHTQAVAQEPYILLVDRLEGLSTAARKVNLAVA